MRTKAIMSFAVLLPMMFTAATWSPAAAQEVSALNGAWITTSLFGSDGEVNENPQRGLYVFVITNETGGNYSMMYVNTAEPRPEYEGEQLTDEERLAAYNSFTANSGRLMVEGDQLTYQAYMAKDPNYMASFPENNVTVTWKIEDGTLTLTRPNGSGLTLRHPGGM